MAHPSIQHAEDLEEVRLFWQGQNEVPAGEDAGLEDRRHAVIEPGQAIEKPCRHGERAAGASREEQDQEGSLRERHHRACCPVRGAAQAGQPDQGGPEQQGRRRQPGAAGPPGGQRFQPQGKQKDEGAGGQGK